MNEIYAHIESHVDDSIEQLFEMVRQPSISAQKLGFDKAPGLMREILERNGFEAEIVQVPNDGLPTVYGYMPASENPDTSPTLLFYCHYDVQPVDPLDLWDTDPFEPTRVDDRLYGRGMSDDKGNIAARLAAIRAFIDERGGVPCNIKMFCEGEEESGSINLPALIAERGDDFKADACIWEGGGRNLNDDPFMYLGLKGVLGVGLSVRALSGDAHSSYAAILPSATWRLLRALASIKDEDERILIDGFYDAIVEPSPEAVAAVEALPDDAPEWLETFGVKTFLKGLDGEDLRKQLIFQPTANIAGLDSGYQDAGLKTVLPAVASAKMDFRLVPEQRPHDIAEKLRKHLDKHGFSDVEVELIAAVNPYRTDLDSPWVQMVAETAEEIYGRKAVMTPNMAGTGPMFDFGDTLGMPIATSGVDHPSHKIHAPNENITIEDFLLGAKHAALIIDRFARDWGSRGDVFSGRIGNGGIE
ncbi:MAG: M20/M25/M40 family metallo-hydrolase [Chloroflexi bacterium]|nr:M20/M25/M40 family metallo-hydrolase [Chloroflexota bacterium]